MSFAASLLDQLVDDLSRVRWDRERSALVIRLAHESITVDDALARVRVGARERPDAAVDPVAPATLERHRRRFLIEAPPERYILNAVGMYEARGRGSVPDAELAADALSLRHYTSHLYYAQNALFRTDFGEPAAILAWLETLAVAARKYLELDAGESEFVRNIRGLLTAVEDIDAVDHPTAARLVHEQLIHMLMSHRALLRQRAYRRAGRWPGALVRVSDLPAEVFARYEIALAAPTPAGQLVFEDAFFSTALSEDQSNWYSRRTKPLRYVIAPLPVGSAGRLLDGAVDDVVSHEQQVLYPPSSCFRVRAIVREAAGDRTVDGRARTHVYLHEVSPTARAWLRAIAAGEVTTVAPERRVFCRLDAARLALSVGDGFLDLDGLDEGSTTPLLRLTTSEARAGAGFRIELARGLPVAPWPVYAAWAGLPAALAEAEPGTLVGLEAIARADWRAIQRWDPNTSAWVELEPMLGDLDVIAQIVAAQIYASLGVELGPPDSGEATPLIDALAAASIDRREAIMAELRRAFVVDGLLGNREVIGDGLDHVAVEPDGRCRRLHARASALATTLAGGDPAVTELDELRDPNRHLTAALMFGGITAKAIVEQIAAVEARLDGLLADLAATASLTELEQALASDWLIDRVARLGERRRRLEAEADRYRAELAPALAAPDEVVTFSREHRHAELVLDGVALSSVELDACLAQPFVELDEPPFCPVEGLRSCAGLIMVEDDGRAWIYEPRDHFGGHVHTFPKGGVGVLGPSPAELQRAAIREAWEETGLAGRITGFLLDQRRTSTNNRYYLGRRIAGDPADAGWEAQNVKLVPISRLAEFLNRRGDRTIAAMLAKLPIGG